jgi:predicted secreted hydrolase
MDFLVRGATLDRCHFFHLNPLRGSAGFNPPGQQGLSGQPCGAIENSMTCHRAIIFGAILGLLLVSFQWGLCSAATGFLQAIHPRAFHFPEDHGDHPGFQTEWWYYTGNLVSEVGRSFGYQLTFFRVQLKPHAVDTDSPWRTNQLYFAHLALSDLEKTEFLTAEKAGRGAMGIGGVSSDRNSVRVFLHGWESIIQGKVHQLRADSDRFGIDLKLVSEKLPVLHGNRGLSRKGGAQGQASYYYTLTRMSSQGTLNLGNETFTVTGSSWMDHEFSSNVLSTDQVGWDWIGLQLSGNRELMLYVLRHKDGSIDPFSSGTLVRQDGRAVHLPKEAFVIKPKDFWESQISGARYPSGWQVDILPHGISLHVTPNLKNQELRTTQSTQVTYWEGSVRVKGTARGEMVTGSGYVELTGYAGEFELTLQGD